MQRHELRDAQTSTNSAGPMKLHAPKSQSAARAGGAARNSGTGGPGGPPQRYLIFASLNSTCLRATGSYFFFSNFSVVFLGFLNVT